MRGLTKVIEEKVPAKDQKNFLWLWRRVMEVDAHTHGIPRLRLRSARDDISRRAIVWTETDMLEGLPTVLKLWATGKFGHLVISGGDYGKEKKRGNLGSVDMLMALVKECRKRKLPVRGINLDNYAMHAGWQGTVVPQILKHIPDPDKAGFVQIKEVVFVAPRYHILRFTLSLIRGFKHEKMRIRVHTAPFGTWKTWHPQKKATYWDLFWNDVGKEGNEIGKIYRYMKWGDTAPLRDAVRYLK